MWRGGEERGFAWLPGRGAVPLLALAGALVLSGCTTAQLAHAVIPAPTAADKAEAQALVESLCGDAGTHIHRTVHDVKGFEFVSVIYYDNGRKNAPTDVSSGGCGPDCVRFLAQGYSYIEIELRSLPRISDKYDVAEKVGRYRYRLVTRPHSSCERYDWTLQMSRAFHEEVARNAERMHNKCIEAVPVTGAPSQYIFEGYFSEPIDVQSLSSGQFAFIGGSRVLDRATREELALAFSYNFRDRHFVGGNQARCGSDQRLEVANVLRPPKS